MPLVYIQGHLWPGPGPLLKIIVGLGTQPLSSVSDVWTLGEGLFILACTIMETDIAVGLLSVEMGES